MNEMKFPDAEWNQTFLNVAKKGTHAWLPRSDLNKLSMPAPPPIGEGLELWRVDQLHTQLLVELNICKKKGETCSHVVEIVAQDGNFMADFIALCGSSATQTPIVELLKELQKMAALGAFFMKNHFMRARPYHYLPALVPATNPPVISRPQHPSYPSGHSTTAHLFAHALSSCKPALRETLFRCAARIAVNREIAGVHFASDSAAGELLATQLFQLLQKNSAAHTMLLSVCNAM